MWRNFSERGKYFQGEKYFYRKFMDDFDQQKVKVPKRIASHVEEHLIAFCQSKMDEEGRFAWTQLGSGCMPSLLNTIDTMLDVKRPSIRTHLAASPSLFLSSTAKYRGPH
jgi:hypothetical protein